MIRPIKFKTWMRINRPSGVGVMTISGITADHKPKEPKHVIKFTEVVCDLCKAEIKPTEKKHEGDTEEVESVIFDDEGSRALCRECVTTYYPDALDMEPKG